MARSLHGHVILGHVTWSASLSTRGAAVHFVRVVPRLPQGTQKQTLGRQDLLSLPAVSGAALSTLSEGGGEGGDQFWRQLFAACAARGYASWNRKGKTLKIMLN